MSKFDWERLWLLVPVGTLALVGYWLYRVDWLLRNYNDGLNGFVR